MSNIGNYMERMTEKEYKAFQTKIKSSITRNRTLILCGPAACGKGTIINEINESLEKENIIHRSLSLYGNINFNFAVQNIIKVLASYNCSVVFCLHKRELAEELKRKKIITVIYMEKRPCK